VRDDPCLPLLVRRADALRAGLSRHQITQRLRSRRWLRLAYGVYVVAEVYGTLPAREQHLVHVAAALLQHGEGHVASHLSAAAVYGWALPLGGAGHPTLTRHSASGPTRRRDAVVQVADLGPRSTTFRDERVSGHRLAIPTTTPARTVADCLRHLRLPDGVALGDSALRSRSVTWAEVSRELDLQRAWPYAAHGRTGLALLDPRRETWLESCSFVTLVQGGCPCPEPQVALYDARDRFVGRVDGWLDDEAVALEPDGRAKYRLDVEALPHDVDAAAELVAASVQRRLIAQNERERRLLELGVQVVRWGTYDITERPQWVLAAVAAARRRGDRSRFTGRAVFQPSPAWLANAAPPGSAPLRPPFSA
jgi:predicted transcriptional regulator of viral defense system